MTRLNADLLVTEDSGGTHTAAKRVAARGLGLNVIVIARPAESTSAVTTAATC